MGAIFSSLKAAVKLVKSLIGVLRALEADFGAVAKRAKAAAPLPHPSPTQPFWLLDPPHPELVDLQSAEMPREAEVVIIGSGITAAATARSLLQTATEESPSRPVPRVVVLEARQLCSGATGRNGGHIKASPHVVLGRLLKQGAMDGARAAELMRFQLRHLPVLTGLCAAEGIEVAECREVETVDLFVDDAGVLRQGWRRSRLSGSGRPSSRCGRGLPRRPARSVKFKANHHVLGAISYKAGALWPYRLVSSVWKTLLSEFPETLSIETGTPATSIDVLGKTDTSASQPGAPQPDQDFPYLISTPRGAFRARHVVHATNAYMSNLVPGLRGKATGVLAHMTAQRPGVDFPRAGGGWSWSTVYAGQAYDYITQRPDTAAGEPGELMIGGGFTCAPKQGGDMIGVYDDSRLDALTVAHLEGIMPTVFRPRWGADEGGGGGPRVKSVWSGVLAFTADLLPLVGRLDEQTTGRKLPRQPRGGGGKPGEHSGASSPKPGEWISAGYCGDGMVWAWLSGTALGIMLSGNDDVHLPAAPGRPEGRLSDWFPPELRPTRERVARMDMMDLADNLM
ncbi:hypothetical protein RB593_009253 [Gaeumannomyces tritici]